MAELTTDRLQELRRTESWFGLVVENVDTVIYIATADLTDALYVNAAYETVYGRSADTVSDWESAFATVVHPEDRERFTDDVDRLRTDIATGSVDESYEGEYRLTVDGETRWVRVSRYPVEDDDEGVAYVVGTVENVSGERRMVRSYRHIFENVSDGLVVHDPDTGEILDVNDRYCDLTGYTQEELVGADIDLVMTDDTAYSPAAARKRIEVARDEGTQLFEWVGERSDGSRFEAEINLTVVEIQGRERVLASVRDITERKRRETQLRDLQQEYETVYENAQDALFLVDIESGAGDDNRQPRSPEEDGAADHRFVYRRLNRSHEEKTGLSTAELRGKTPREVFGDDPGGDIEANYRRCFESQETITYEEVLSLPGGERLWQTKLSPVIVDDEVRQIVGIARDITKRKRHEQVIEALHESTTSLHEAATRTAVCEAAFEAARTVLDLQMPACWLYEDGDPPALVPVAAPDPAWEASDGPGRFEPGSVGYDAFERDEVVSYAPSDRRADSPLDRGVLIPLGDHGLLGIADPNVDEFDEFIVDAARILARHTTTALDRVARATERRESERRMGAILNRIDEAIFLSDSTRLLDEESGSVYASAGYEDVFGLSYAALEADPEREFIDLVHPEDRQEYAAAIKERVRAVERREHDDRYQSEYRIRRPDGETRWVQSDFYPTEWDDGYRFVIVSRDITRRKERAQTLETFHEATRQLTAAGSRTDASQVAVDAAARVLGLSHVSVHLFDEDAGTLRPVSETDALRSRVDFLPSFGPGDNLPWQVFVEGEAVGRADVDVDNDLFGAGVADPELILPLGSHGVMLVGTPGREFDAETVELAQILASTLEGALNHVRGQHELQEREAELEEHRERAERLEQLNTVIREVEQATVDESTRDAIEAVVCDRLTTVDAYQVAWVADRERESLVTRTSKCDGAGDVHSRTIDLETTGVDPHPAAEAYATAETRTVRNVATDRSRGAWRKPMLRAGYQSVTAVPLAHDETVHGVLCIAAADPAAFDDRAESILTELGRSVGHALSVLARRRALESDTTTELEFAGGDDQLLLVRLAHETESEVTLERTIRRTSGQVAGFYRVDGAAPETVRETAAALSRVGDVTLISADDSDEQCLVELETASWFGERFVDHGAVVRTAESDGTETTIVVEAPQAADVRALVTDFRETYPETELVAQRTRERSVQTLLELRDVLGDRLTPRQLETLETAYSAGYFDWPREQSGEEIADLLGITQPTFNKHLRSAERKAFSMLLNDESSET